MFGRFPDDQLSTIRFCRDVAEAAEGDRLGLAALASGLLCLVILPLYPLCWVVDYFEQRWEDK